MNKPLNNTQTDKALMVSIKGALRWGFKRTQLYYDVKGRNRRYYTKFKKDGSPYRKKGVELQCEECGKWVIQSHTAVDHIFPVVDVVEGFQGWEKFIARLYCPSENLQVLCAYKQRIADSKYDGVVSCHTAKTKKESGERKVYRELTKLTDEFLDRPDEFYLLSEGGFV